MGGVKRPRWPAWRSRVGLARVAIACLETVLGGVMRDRRDSEPGGLRVAAAGSCCVVPAQVVREGGAGTIGADRGGFWPPLSVRLCVGK